MPPNNESTRLPPAWTVDQSGTIHSAAEAANNGIQVKADGSITNDGKPIAIKHGAGTQAATPSYPLDGGQAAHREGGPPLVDPGMAKVAHRSARGEHHHYKHHKHLSAHHSAHAQDTAKTQVATIHIDPEHHQGGRALDDRLAAAQPAGDAAAKQAVKESQIKKLSEATHLQQTGGFSL